MRVGLLLLALVAIVALAAADGSRSLRLKGRSHRRSADDLRAYYRKQRAQQKSQNYYTEYPDEPITSFLNIGTPGKFFMVSLETGVDSMWVVGPYYPSAANHDVYDPSNSTTGIDAGYYYGNSGDFYVYGEGYTDVVDFFGPVNQTFGAIEGTYGGFELDPDFPDFDGVFGMEWNPKDASGPFDSTSAPILNMFAMFQAQYPDLPRSYTVWRETLPEFEPSSDSEIIFGGDLDDLCDSNYQYAPLSYDDDTRSLTFQLDSFTFGNYTTSSDVAKVDTGLPVIFVPYEVFYEIYERVQPSFDWDTNTWQTPCSNRGVLPDWVFTINGNEFTIPSKSYIVDLGIGDGNCVLAFDYTQGLETPYAFGFPFLTEYCQKMDIDNAQVGFSRALKLTEGTTQSP